MAETLSAGEALIALRATSDKLSADMAAASSKIVSELQKVEKQSASFDFGKVFSVGLKAAAAFAGGVVAAEGALAALTVKAVEQGDEIGRMSDAYGIAAETLTGLKRLAGDNDIAFGELQVSLKTFTNLLGDAAAGSDTATEAVGALGIDVAKLKDGTLDTDQALRIAADTLGKMGDGYNKATISTTAFGRAGAKIPVIFKDGAAGIDAATESALKMGDGFDQKAVRAAQRLDDQMDELSNRTKGLATSIGKDLMPVAGDIVDQFNQWLDKNSDLLRQDIKGFAEGLQGAFESLLPVAKGVAEAMGWLGEVMSKISPPKGSLAALTKEEADLDKQTRALAGSLALANPQTEKAKAEVDQLRLRHESLSSQLSVTRERLAALKGPTDQHAASMADLNRVTDEEAAAADKVIRSLKATPAPTLGAADANKKAAEAAKKAAEANEQLQRSIDALHMDALADDLNDATKALEANRSVAGDENYLRALQDIQKAYDAQVEAIKRSTEEAIQAGADRELAAQNEALEVEKAQRQMQDAVEKLDGVLVKNAGTWEDLGQQILDLPDEVRAFIPTLDGIAAAAGKVDEATFGMTKATEAVSPAAEVASGTISDLSKAIVGLIDNSSNAGDVLKALAGNITDNLGSTISKALSSSDFGKGLTDSLSGVFGPALGGAIATAGMSAVVQVGAGIFMSGVSDAMKGEAESAAAKIGLVVGGPIGAAIGVGIVSAFGIGQQSMVEQIAAQLGEMFKASFKADAVVTAINSGLEEVGLFLGAGLEVQMIRAPKDMGADVTAAWKELGTKSSHQFSDGFYQDMKEKGTQLIHSSIADVLNVFFPDLANDLAVGIQQSAVAAGSAIAAEMGLIGDKAVKFAQQWGIAFIGMAQKAGLSADEILTALHRIDSSLGTSQELVASLQRLQAELIESGVDMDALFAEINKQLTMITGKKVKVGNLDEVLAAVGGDATRALGVIENGMEMAGISIEKFTGQLSDVVLAISGDAGTAIREAGEDFRDFGNEADGTARILREKVLSAIDAVIATAEELGYSSESIDAFKTAVGLIPPEMLRSSEFVNALREDFARMAVESHMSVQELVDSIDPPLPEATRNAILAVNDLGKAIGDLTGAPLKNLKEVTDRMKQFGDEMYRSVVDSEGKVTQELTAFGQELVDEASTAISGMWSQMNEDGWVGLDEIGVMFDQLALLPVEALNDPAIQQATRDLLAKIGAMTGDAAIIAMANAETITQDMIDQGLAAYDEYKKTIEENPPEVPAPTTPEGAPTDPTVDPTAPATGAPPPQPIPPETTESYQKLADTATEYAKAVLAGREATEALAPSVVSAAALILGSLTPLIGEPGDGHGVADLNDMLGRVIPQTLEDLTLDIAGACGDWKGSFDFARGAVNQLHTAIDDLPTDKTVTITVNQVGGTDVTTPTPLPGGATGGWIPGAIGEPFPMIAHGGEFILPADIAQRVVGGGTAPMMATRSADPAPTSSASSDWVAVPVRRKDLAEGAVLELARATQTGRAHVDGRQIHVSPTYGRRR
jgi:hypothetical protein